jgi:UDP-2,3-diacylglucosamine hydrolase
MGRRIGIVAGSGLFVSAAVSELRRRGLRCAVLGIKGESSPGLRAAADSFLSIAPGELGRALAFFKSQGISETLFLGKVRPSVVFRRANFDAETWKRLAGLKEKSPSDLLETVFAWLEAGGIKVVNPRFLLAPHFCRPGVLTRAAPAQAILKDIRLGLKVARQAADLEIGQTVAVKDGVIVAVEDLEGTDRAIRRGGRLAGPGFVVAKAGRTAQDMRIDVPAVGRGTVESLVRAGGAALAIEAGKVAFFQKEEAVSLADSRGVSIVVRAVG